MGTAEISSWASEDVALNKSVIITGYNDESKITMNGDWTLQGNTTITDVKMVLAKDNLSIYANGYNLVLGTEGDKESLKIGEADNTYYPDVYGGSSTKALSAGTNLTINSGRYRYIYGGSNNQAITGNTNLTINYAIAEQSIYGGSNQGAITGSTDLNVGEKVIVGGSIYGGSKSGTISQNTNLTITDAEVNGSVYGGSESGTINGNTVTNITAGRYGIIATSNGTNEVAISGGSKNSSIAGNVNLTIENATIINGYVSGAGNSTGVSGTINLTINKIKLGDSGTQTNSIYGFGYAGGTNACKDITITIKEITGKPQYIMGYAYSDGGSPTGTITMNLSNINSTQTEIYGGVYSGTQTAAVASTITTSNVKAKLLSPGGITAKSIKSFSITVNGGSFSNGIYAGLGTNSSASSNVVDNYNTLNLNNYSGLIYVRNKVTTVNLNNSNVTTGTSFYYSNISMINSTLEIASLTSTSWSLGNVTIDENSELTINSTKRMVFYGSLSGKGTLRIADTATVLFNSHGITGPLEIDIIEDSDTTSSYVNIISAQKETQDELYLNEELTGYTTEFAEAISYWKFYIGDNAIKGAADCVYLHGTYGDDANSGEITAPVKTIERASEIIKNNSEKKKVVITAHLNLNQETAKSYDTSGVYTIVTTTDGTINFLKYVNLNVADSNIYQNIEFQNIRMVASSGTKNIYLNGNSLRIVSTTVTTSGTIDIYGGSNTGDLTGINGSIEINGGTWHNIYGGSKSANITGNTNININGGTISNIYGGCNSGNITGDTNVSVTSGTITNLYGGNYSGTITGNTNVTISGGKVSTVLYGGNYQGTITGSTNVNVTGGTISSNLYGGNYAGTIKGTANTKITGGTISAHVYGGCNTGSIVSDAAANIVGGTDLQISGVTIDQYNVYGGSNSGAITGNVNITLKNVTFGKSDIFRGSNSGTITGQITSTIENIVTTTNGNIYGGSNSGKIVGDVEFSLGAGAFKNNVNNARTMGGSNTGTISGNLDFSVSNITTSLSIYGGNRSGGYIDGDTNIVVDGVTCKGSIYSITRLGLSSSIKEANTNVTEIKNSTVASNIYGVSNVVGSNVLSNPIVTIDNVTFKYLYPFYTYASMNTTLEINVINSKSTNNEIQVKASMSDHTKDLSNVLNLNLKDNKSPIIFEKEMKLNNLKVENCEVIAEDILKTNNLTLNSSGKLDLKKNASVTNTFAGATDGNNGSIEVYDGLSIGGATGSTTLTIGTVTETKTSSEEYSPEESFVNIVDGENIIGVEDQVVGTNKTRTWQIGNVNRLNVVYLNGTSGSDENSGEDAANAVATLKQAYYYCRTGGTIVVCGPTTVTEWPQNYSKVIKITSQYDTTDYRNTNSAKLVLNVAESSINLEADTVFEYLNIQVSKTQNIYASGNSLTLGDAINVVDASGNQTTAYLNIYGGSSTTSVQTANVTINSGSYNFVDGAGIGNTGTTKITINGGNINTIRTKANSEYSSKEFNLVVANATVGNIYYEPDKTTEITLNSGSSITNINAETYSQDIDATCNININTTNPINIDGKNKGNCNVNFAEMTIGEYSSSIKNVAKINMLNSEIKYTKEISGIEEIDAQNSTISINGTTLETSNLTVNSNSQLVIENTINSLTLGTVSFDNTSTIKVLSPLTTLNLSGDFNGGGNIYLNDAIRLEIAGKVTGSTTVYCNSTEYFQQGTMITATISEDTMSNAFIIPESNESWRYKDNDNTRIWMSKEFTINNIIYVNSTTGTSYGLGTESTPVDTLETAYKIANKRYNENNESNQYYILLQEDLTVTEAIVNTKINENVEVIITNTVSSDSIKYDTSLKINTGKFNFVGKTTIENITIDTTEYANSVEFFADGNEVTFGSGIVVNSQSQKYPIIYAGNESGNLVQDEINLTVLSGKYNMIFGGGKNGSVNANINLTIGDETDTVDLKGYEYDDDNYTGLFGAGRYGVVEGNISVNVNSGSFNRIYGAGLQGALIGNAEINFKGGQTNRIYGGGQNAEVDGDVIINIGNSSTVANVSDFLRGSGQYSGITGTTEVNIYEGALLERTQVAAGGYQGNVSTSKLNLYGGTVKCDVYGGGWGNIGDSTKGRAENTEVHIYPNATIEGDIYGGGYAGPATNTNVIIEGATINNVYGGGNEAEINENTNVRIRDAIIMKSAYGGGKGITATVKGNSTIIVEGTAIIKENLFGGGNASMTGLEDNNSVTNVYIVGGTINGDVYGGANTSVVYGNTNVKIGKEAVNIEELSVQPIEIDGTVFGGGKSNTAGSEDYDFTFESVTGDVNIDINAKDIELNIGTSIFASGNAAKISGNGYVKISNYGTYEVPKRLVSIQRATDVNIDNSALWILGTTDRTNEMSSIKYTINRVKTLELKNNATLYLENGVNLVETLKSLDSEGNLEYVNIDEESGSIEQNVDNKIYLLHGKNMVLLTEDGGNGSVYGMMFLGKFDSNQNEGVIEKGIYASEYAKGDIVNEEDKNKLAKNSYLQAQHYVSHDIKIDGFYTNNVTEDSKIDIQYIIPTPEEGTFYQWLIGEMSETVYYDEIELIASKYSSTAQVTLDLVGLNAPDMILEVKNIDTSLLNNSVILKDETAIPNIAQDADTANSIFGLTMQTGNQGWKADGKTNYLYQYDSENVDENNYGIVQGTTSYYADKSNITPTLTFNFAHSKNVSSNIDLGKVSINLQATYLEGETLVTRDVIIELLLRVSNASSDIEYYEGAITPGLRYSVFPNAATNVTSKSAISAYYSIYLNNYDTNKYYANYQGYYHAIYSSFALPEGTKIIMIDQSNDNDKYYYYIVTSDDEQNGKMIYKFTDFTAMGTLDEKYNSDSAYYNKEQNHVIEEFIVQLDFENANITQDYLGASLKIQLMDNTDNSVKLTVNDAIYPMMYNIYSDEEPEKTLAIDKDVIQLYEPEDLNFKINTSYVYKTVNSNVVYDTTNFDNAQGLKITFHFNENQLTKEDLGEISVTYNGITHFVSEDGSIRFKVADAVCNLETSIKLNLTSKNNWNVGTYTMLVEAIGSADGVNAAKSISSDSANIIFADNEYGLDVNLDSNSQIIDKGTGKTLNDNNTLEFNIEYETSIANPNIRIALYRRDYETIYTAEYNLVDLKEFVKDELTTSNNEKEYIITENPQATQKFVLNLKDDNTLKTGTYKIKFLVYDGEIYIGEVYKMIIIK